MASNFSPVIGIDDSKCKNCHTCIEVCPVKYCIDGSGDVIRINHEHCIGCGRCIDACRHKARFPLDDGEAFFRDAARGTRFVAIIAPAAASGFAGKMNRLVAWLRSIGARAVFDASFGAELTTESYLRFLKEKNPSTVISQPCPAIVSYIELYRPELLPYLAPVDSPLMHSARMIRAKYPEYADARIVAITPCLAKKREFEDTGVISYNVTFISVMAEIQRRKADLAKIEPSPFDGPEAERGSGYPVPGGLMRTVARENPGAARRTRTIEGTDQLYRYLDTLKGSIDTKIAPLIVDCLNCPQGCIVGPGSRHQDLPLDLLKSLIERRINDKSGISESPKGQKSNARQLRRLRTDIAAAMKGVDFTRRYADRSGSIRVSTPTKNEQERIFARMGKQGQEDIFDCAACGYGSCEAMAKAIHNGLNKPENCYHYQKKCLEEDQRHAKELSGELHGRIMESEKRMQHLNEIMETLAIRCSDQAATIEESSAAIENMLAALNRASDISTEKRKSLENLAEGSKRGEKGLAEINGEIEGIRDSVAGIGGMSDVISEIAEMINLLSMNAAIEAAHAGAAGKGFAVISGEVKRLADSSTKNSSQISEDLSSIEVKIANSAKASLEATESIRDTMSEISRISTGIKDLFDLLAESSAGSTQLQESLRQMRESTVSMSESYDSIRRDLADLSESVSEIRKASDENLKAMGEVSQAVPDIA